nr:glycoside hydrolase N-terminal domain-containing protein [Streptomyces sp. MBT53]
MPSSSRRDFLRLTGVAGGGLAAFGGLPPFVAHADPERPAHADIVPEAEATTLWYRQSADESRIIQEALPVGNGRMGALVGCDPADDFVYLTDGSFWTGGRNDTPTSDGQLPYGADDFGSFGLLAKLRVTLPAHTAQEISGYRRGLDLSNGVVSATYRHRGARFRREIYASHPDDVIVVRLTGGGTHTGAISLEGTHGETTSADGKQLSFAATLKNGLRWRQDRRRGEGLRRRAARHPCGRLPAPLRPLLHRSRQLLDGAAVAGLVVAHRRPTHRRVHPGPGVGGRLRPVRPLPDHHRVQGLAPHEPPGAVDPQQHP